MFNTEKPKLIQQIYNAYQIRFDVREGKGPEEEDGWEYTEVEVSNLKYATVVSGIIHSKYPIDAEIAIINNLIVDPENRVEEWNNYQSWRTFAKEYTSETLGLKKENE